MEATSSATANAQVQRYQGQFGWYQIEAEDRREVATYRTALAVAAAAFALGTGLAIAVPDRPWVGPSLAVLYGIFCGALGVSLWTIHIYLVPLHRLLQGFWLAGTAISIGLACWHPTDLLATIYDRPLWLLGVGWIFVALTGIYFKEAFCFGRLETLLLVPLVPAVLLGHLFNLGILASVEVQQGAIALWSLLFAIFALRKAFQPIPDDIGDKSVFDYLKRQRSAHQAHQGS